MMLFENFTSRIPTRASCLHQPPWCYTNSGWNAQGFGELGRHFPLSPTALPSRYNICARLCRGCTEEAEARGHLEGFSFSTILWVRTLLPWQKPVLVLWQTNTSFEIKTEQVVLCRLFSCTFWFWCGGGNSAGLGFCFLKKLLWKQKRKLA